MCTEVDIGKHRLENEYSDACLIEKFREKFKLRNDLKVIYTDASKIEGGISVGIGVVFDGEEIAYDLSINPKCTVFTGELIAIENALKKVADRRLDKDILILTDSKSSVEAIQNNKLSAHSASAVVNIREMIHDYKNKENDKENTEERKIVIGVGFPVILEY